MDWMRDEMNGLLLINQRMVNGIVQLRAGQVHNQDNPIVIDSDDSSSEEGMIAEASDVPEQFCLVLIKEEVVVDSEEEDSDDEVWEITREEFEDEVVDARDRSPKL